MIRTALQPCGGTAVAASADRAGSRPADPVRAAWEAAFAAIDTVLCWQERARQRRQLLEMDDRLLSDIGVTRAEAEAEFEKPFWRP